MFPIVQLLNNLQWMSLGYDLKFYASCFKGSYVACYVSLIFPILIDIKCIVEAETL